MQRVRRRFYEYNYDSESWSGTGDKRENPYTSAIWWTRMRMRWT
ncbi:hypothetical protein [Clostridium sp. 1001283B150225_161107_B6]|nr:hypothetical protein [Clostridium sp. 1001283B150225_161107_B6]